VAPRARGKIQGARVEQSGPRENTSQTGCKDARRGPRSAFRLVYLFMV